MISARFLGFVAVLSSLIGCAYGQGNQSPAPTPSNDEPAQQQAEAPPVATTKPAAPEAELKLIDAGQEPRSTLRYAPAVGAKQAVSIRVRTSGSQSFGTNRMAGARAPAQVFRMETEVKNISSTGDIDYLFGITEGAAIDERGIDPLTLKGMQEMAQSIVGVTGNMTISSTGRNKHAAVVPPPNATRGATRFIAWTLQGVRNALEMTWVLLPDEPIGVGAKWQVTSHSNANPNYANFKQIALYEVTAIDGERVQLNMTLTESAEPQVLQNQSSEVVPMSLLSHDGRGKGTATLNLSNLMPLLAVMNVDADTEVQVQLSASHQEHHMRNTHQENSVETILE